MISLSDTERGAAAHRVYPPGGAEPAAWAAMHSTADPTFVPLGWPESTRMCLLVVYRRHGHFDRDSETIGFLVARPEAMHFLATMDRTPQLWFVLPRRLFTAEVCPTLRPDHWPPEEK
jgi:hypothetical protein